MSFRQLITASLFSILMHGTGFAAASVTLAWNPSPVGGVGGYRLYHGLFSQDYGSPTDIGHSTNATVVGLVAGKTYYFAVTVYETNGLESPLSGEVSYAVPIAGATLQMTVNNSGQAVLSGTAPAGYRYDVQVSANAANSAAMNWVAIGSVTVSATNTFEFTDPASATSKTRFYRLRQTYP